MTSVWILLFIYSALRAEISWDEYKEKYQLNFENDEDVLRRRIFEENVNKIEAENAMGHSYKLAINHFAHLTKKELKSMFMTPNHDTSIEDEIKESQKYSADFQETPSEEVINADLDVDWRRNGYVTSVKSQGKCGSCYTFGTTANLESARAMKNKVLEDLSPQQLLDCSTNNGCTGGSEFGMYPYLIAYGAMTWSSYPYKFRKGPCNYRKEAVVTKPAYYRYVSGGSDETLINSVTKRPTTTRVHANIFSFLYYSSGVYDDVACTPWVFDHIVVVVGVVQNPKDNYYILKNSWGPNWGIGGYMHLGKTRANPCGISRHATYLVMP